MALKRWIKQTSDTKFTNKWWSYKVDTYLFPSGKQGEYHYAFTHGSVFIVPVTPQGKIIMVNQYRYLNDRFSIEFPGGGVKTENGHDEQARKELIEETGFDGELKCIGEFNPYNGVTNEICKVYIAKNLKTSNEFAKDESEEFEMMHYSLDEIEKMISTNEIYDGMSLATWSLVRTKL